MSIQSWCWVQRVGSWKYSEAVKQQSYRKSRNSSSDNCLIINGKSIKEVIRRREKRITRDLKSYYWQEWAKEMRTPPRKIEQIYWWNSKWQKFSIRGLTWILLRIVSYKKAKSNQVDRARDQSDQRFSQLWLSRFMSNLQSWMRA